MRESHQEGGERDGVAGEIPLVDRSPGGEGRYVVEDEIPLARRNFRELDVAGESEIPLAGRGGERGGVAVRSHSLRIRQEGRIGRYVVEGEIPLTRRPSEPTSRLPYAG